MRKLTDVAQKQIPYATARALTRLAKNAQAEVVGTLPRHFTIRNQYVARGIGITRAEKKDWPHAHSIVGSRSWFMALQEEGGEKKPTTLPFVPVPKKARLTHSDLISAANKPKRLLSQVNSNSKIKIETLRKSGTQAIVYRPQHKAYKKRAKRGSASAQRRKAERDWRNKFVRVLWVLKPTTHIKKRWDLFEVVQRSVQGNYNKEFGKALKMSIESSKFR